MRHASLFSGIGGFDLAAEWMGWTNVFHCDINPFGKKVLEYYYPNSISYGDITKTDFSVHRGDIDILTGGFPCQPYSLAGKRKGKEDERHLWPQMLRAIKEIQPRWIIGENVYGLVNWDGGLVFHEVQSDLEAEGYEVFPYVLPACSINAPHRRDRVFFIAYDNNGIGKKNGFQTRREKYMDRIEGERIATYTDKFRCNERNGEYAEQSINGRLDALNDVGKMSAQESSTDSDSIGCGRKSEESGSNISEERKMDKNIGFDRNGIRSKTNGCSTFTTDTLCERLEWSEINGSIGEGGKKSHKFIARCIRKTWENFPTVSPICDGDDGISDRLDSITFSKWRKQSIMAGGNAVVPQLIYVLFKTITKFEQLKNNL